VPRDQATAGYLRAQATDVDVVTRVGHEASQRDLDAFARMTRFSQARSAANAGNAAK
jgi:hypothetical protein